MVTEPEQPAEQPVMAEQPAEAPVVANAATVTVEDVDDTAPLTVKETLERGKRIVQTAKHGILKPAYRFGRRSLWSAQKATEAFFEGVLNEKKDKK